MARSLAVFLEQLFLLESFSVNNEKFDFLLRKKGFRV